MYKKKHSSVFPKLMLLLCSMAVLFLCTCKPKKICPAYQSAFYIDDAAAEHLRRVIEVGEDSMPVVRDLVKKTDVLLVKPMKKKKKEKLFATVPMIVVYPPIDSSRLQAAQATDSTELDDEDKPIFE